jgi:hypothetical protein
MGAGENLSEIESEAGVPETNDSELFDRSVYDTYLFQSQ